MNKLVIYPEYPARVKRNYDYKVVVNQGSESHEIPVYNELRQSAATREPWGDDYRRFAEFAFEGEGVRIDITVNMSFSEYTVMPAIANLKSTVKDNVISVYLDKPEIFMIRLNDKVNTMLAVFAEAPEDAEDIPDRNAEGVIYIDSGKWHNEPDNFLRLGADQTLYIAPGAVCNARVIGDGDNIKILGRGMVRDPFDTRTVNVHSVNYNVNITNSKNPVVKGIKIVDCRFYHIYFGNCEDVYVEGIKLLSNVISTDGTKVHNIDGLVMKNCYADVGDDVFTLSGDTPEKCRDLYYENIICGSTCGIFSFTGIKGGVQFKDISVFRCDESMFKHFYTSTENTPYGGVDIDGLYGVDCVFIPTIFHTTGQGSGHKDIRYKNVSAIMPAGTQSQEEAYGNRPHKAVVIANGEDFEFNFENIWLDGKLCKTVEDLRVANRSGKDAVFNIKADEESGKWLPLKSNTTVLDKPYVAEIKREPVKPHENLLPNGGFEDGVDAWVASNFAKLELSENAHSGKYSLYVPAHLNWGGTHVGVKDIFLRGGAGKYKLTFFALRGPLGEVTTINCALSVRYGEITDNANMPTQTFRFPTEVTDKWTKYEYEIEIPEEMSSINTAYLNFINSTPGGELSFYLDDVTLEKIG